MPIRELIVATQNFKAKLTKDGFNVNFPSCLIVSRQNNYIAVVINQYGIHALAPSNSSLRLKPRMKLATSRWVLKKMVSEPFILTPNLASLTSRSHSINLRGLLCLQSKIRYGDS